VYHAGRSCWHSGVDVPSGKQNEHGKQVSDPISESVPLGRGWWQTHTTFMQEPRPSSPLETTASSAETPRRSKNSGSSHRP